MVDAASTEGRDPIADIYAINKELEAYNADIAHRPQVIAANKTDAISIQEDGEDPVANVFAQNLNPRELKYYPISAVSGQGTFRTLVLCK